MGDFNSDRTGAEIDAAVTSGTSSTGNTIQSGYGTFDGGVHVNGTSDPADKLVVSGLAVINSYTGTAAGGGIDAVSPTINVQSINGEVVTTIFIDIGAGLIISDNGAGEVIGEDGIADAYLTRITNAVNGMVYKGEMICLEIPTTGDPDINLSANSSGTIAQEDAGEGQHVLINASSDAWTLGELESITIPAGGIVNDYLYLTHGGTTAGTYDAGKFLIKLYGYVV